MRSIMDWMILLGIMGIVYQLGSEDIRLLRDVGVVAALTGIGVYQVGKCRFR